MVKKTIKFPNRSTIDFSKRMFGKRNFEIARMIALVESGKNPVMFGMNFVVMTREHYLRITDTKCPTKFKVGDIVEVTDKKYIYAYKKWGRVDYINRVGQYHCSGSIPAIWNENQLKLKIFKKK